MTQAQSRRTWWRLARWHAGCLCALRAARVCIGPAAEAVVVCLVAASRACVAPCRPFVRGTSFCLMRQGRQSGCARRVISCVCVGVTGLADCQRQTERGNQVGQAQNHPPLPPHGLDVRTCATVRACVSESGRSPHHCIAQSLSVRVAHPTLELAESEPPANPPTELCGRG